MKANKIYNMFFPVWFLILLPPVWLIAIPLNFLIDSLVLLIALKAQKIETPKHIYTKSILKVFLFGFVADIIGSGLLFLIQEVVASDISWNPYTNITGISSIIIATALSGVIIYILNRLYSFNLPHVTEKNKKRLAVIIAIFTLPYMFLVPTSVLYKNIANSVNFVSEQNSYKNVSTYEDYINKYQDVYLGDNSKMVAATQAAKNIIGIEPFVNEIKNISYSIDADNFNFIINYDITNIDDSKIGQYNKWSEKLALLIIEASINVKQIEFNITTNYSTTIQTIYSKDYFEYKYSTPFESIIKDPEYIRALI